MAANSEVSALALPGSPYGTFTGKEASAGSGPHNPGALSEVSCLSLTGGLYGSFAGKEESAPVVVTAAASPVGGWVYDPYSRRRRRKRDDDEPQPPPVPVYVPDRPRVDIAALDAKIAALGEQIQRSRRGRVRLREQLRALETERAIQIALARRLRLLRDDDEWFMLS